MNNDVSDLEALSVSGKYGANYGPGMSINDFNNLEIGVESA
jgi:hypothetical protein